MAQEKNFTLISLVDYIITTGIITRQPTSPKLIGYCVETPMEIFQRLFSEFYVTRYNKHELFSSNIFDDNTPMKGLSISLIEPIVGIKGNLSEILALEKLNQVKRQDSVSKSEIEKIKKYVKDGDGLSEDFSYLGKLAVSMNPNSSGALEYLQNKKEIKDVIEILDKIH